MPGPEAIVDEVANELGTGPGVDFERRTDGATVVRHDLHGPSDLTAVLEPSDRRYRNVRGDEDPYSSSDPT